MTSVRVKWQYRANLCDWGDKSNNLPFMAQGNRWLIRALMHLVTIPRLQEKKNGSLKIFFSKLICQSFPSHQKRWLNDSSFNFSHYLVKWELLAPKKDRKDWKANDTTSCEKWTNQENRPLFSFGFTLSVLIVSIKNSILVMRIQFFQLNWANLA